VVRYNPFLFSFIFKFAISNNNGDVSVAIGGNARLIPFGSREFKILRKMDLENQNQIVMVSLNDLTTLMERTFTKCMEENSSVKILQTSRNLNRYLIGWQKRILTGLQYGDGSRKGKSSSPE
jgi:hypothetical protein